MVWNINTISTLQFSMFNRGNVQRTMIELQRAGQEVSTGKKVDIYASLGPRATSVARLRASEADDQTFMQANDVLAHKLEAMMTSVDAVRDSLGAVLQTAITNATRPTNGAEVLQNDAKAALESVVAALNISFNGDYLFSGLASDKTPLTRWSETNPDTGLSPEDVMNSLFGAGPTNAMEADGIAAAIDVVFASADPGDPNRDFEATFYNGTRQVDSGGQPTRQVNAWIKTGQEVVYGARANDEPFREAIKGLAMLAVTDVGEMDEAAYATYMSHAIEALTTAQEGLLEVSSRIGFNQQTVETAQSQLTDLSVVRRTQISELEGVDPYEAITRMQSLETQLQASYQVSSRLSGLSILNYLR